MGSFRAAAAAGVTLASAAGHGRWAWRAAHTRRATPIGQRRVQRRQRGCARSRRVGSRTPPISAGARRRSCTPPRTFCSWLVRRPSWAPRRGAGGLLPPQARRHRAQRPQGVRRRAGKRSRRASRARARESRRIKISLEGAPAKDPTLTIDGQTVSAAVIGIPKPVNPGQHTVTAHASNAESEPVTITVPEGASQNVTLTMHAVANAAPPPVASAGGPEAAPEPAHASVEADGHSGLRVAGWVGIGVGVVGAGLGTFFIVKSHSDRNSADSLCGATTCPMSKKSEIDDLDSSSVREATLAWVSYGVGVAGLGTGIALLVMSGSKGKTEPQAAGLAGARPWVGPGSAGVTVRF